MLAQFVCQIIGFDKEFRLQVLSFVIFMLQFISFFSFILYVFSQSTVFQKVLLRNQEAKCLDGTPGAYYISPGRSIDKIMLFFQGGPLCGGNDLTSVLQSCYKQSFTPFGSSKDYPDQVVLDIGILSNLRNDTFSNATKVILKYCDGAGHQGYRKSSISFKGSNIFFKGNIITQNQLDDIEQTQGIFSRANQIYIVGQSIGSTAVLQWANYIRKRAKASKISAIIDSGLNLDVENFLGKYYIKNYLVNLFKISNAQLPPPIPQCIHSNLHQHYKCMFTENLYSHLQVPLFVVQSLYDPWTIKQVLGISCINQFTLQLCNESEMSFIESYHQKINSLLSNIIEKSSQNGYWGISCVMGEFLTKDSYTSTNYRVPMKSSNSVQYSLKNWSSKKGITNAYLDKQNWPSNKLCSGR